MSFNVEAALAAWLEAELRVPAFVQVPDDRPDEFVTVRRTGGSMSVGIDYPVVAADAWGQTAYEASELALKVRDLMLYRAVEIPEVRHVDVGGGPYLSPDADSRQPAYRTTFNMTTE